MKRCSVRPYEGEEKYIFVSYCHKDKASVFPIIEQLAKEGYRIWYDEGIDPGSEWPETIASHLDKCSICIAFITENSLNSHNCRREINFALLKKKNFISIVLESVQMSLGMEMQLSATQSIFKFKLPSEEEFYNKLYETKFLSECLGKPDGTVIVSKASDYADLEKEIFAEKELKRDTFSDKWFIGNNSKKEDNTEIKTDINNENSRIEKLEKIEESKPVEQPKKIEQPVVYKEESKVNEEPKKLPEVKNASRKKTKVFLPVIAIAVTVTVASIIGIIFLIIGLGKAVGIGGEKGTEIAGEIINTDENSVRVENKQITEEDVKNIALLSKLEYLTFDGCQIDSGALKYLNESSSSLISLHIIDCGLTDEQFNEICFSNFPNLTSLDFKYNSELTDISNLSELKDVRYIRIDMTGVKDIGVLSAFDKLDTVYASGNGIEDISALANKTQLSVLYLNNNKISDISVLSGCNNLYELELANNEINSLDALNNCEKLHILNVYGNNLETLNGLENAIELEEINASNNKIISINGLTNCTVLNKVQLNNNCINDIGVLAKSVSKMSLLSADNNEIEDISALRGTNKLKWLYLSNNKISDISALETAYELEEMSLNNNQIIEVGVIENLGKLNKVLLSDNQITDVSSIETLVSKNSKGFQVIDLSRNNISKVDFSFSSSVQFLFLYGNPINSIDLTVNEGLQCIKISYNESIEFEQVFKATFVDVVDCPLDKKMSVKEFGSVGFETIEEADKAYEGIFNIFESVEVKNLIGLKYEEAARTLYESNLGVICVEEYSDEYEAGTVFKQNIAYRDYVSKYSQITVTVSKGSDK